MQGKAWDEADAHADALIERTAAEPLPYSDLIVAGELPAIGTVGNSRPFALRPPPTTGSMRWGRLCGLGKPSVEFRAMPTFRQRKVTKELELRLGREARTGVHCRLFSSAYLGGDDDLDERVYMRWIVR